MPTGQNAMDNLLSLDSLDRASPDLWPEQLPGMNEFAQRLTPFGHDASPSKDGNDWEKPDAEIVNELEALTATQLLEKIRKLQNIAFYLGIEENREINRARLLNVLDDHAKNS